jgi:hypothetical protein
VGCDDDHHHHSKLANTSSSASILALLWHCYYLLVNSSCFAILAFCKRGKLDGTLTQATSKTLKPLWLKIVANRAADGWCRGSKQNSSRRTGSPSIISDR